MTRPDLATDPRYPWLVLAAAPGLGPKGLDRLLTRFGSAAEIIAAGVPALSAAGLPAPACAAIAQPDRAAIIAALRWADRPQAHILTRADPAYPKQLTEIADPPILMFVQGDPEVLSDPQVAIVGSRSPTPEGLEITAILARELARSGLTITSGLALGVDGAAHEGALEAGRTVAVLGTGPDRIYPARHQVLAHRIADIGALVTEYPPGTDPRPGHFPRRNRLISGLSLGTLVTEAAQQSGSLITARLALEQGREVFAVPGSIRNPRARGCHALIRQGAKLVECTQDVLAELAPSLRSILAAGEPNPMPRDDPLSEPENDALDAEYRHLLGCLGYDPAAPDELIARSALPAASVSSMLLVLELQGYVSSCPGGRYRRAARGGEQPA